MPTEKKQLCEICKNQEYCKDSQCYNCHKKNNDEKEHTFHQGVGKITSNPFFNFLRVYRERHAGWPVTKIASEGAKLWAKLSEACRLKYRLEAMRASRMNSRSRRKRAKKHKRYYEEDSDDDDE